MNKFFAITMFFLVFVAQVAGARDRNVDPDTMTQAELEAYMLESDWEKFKCPEGTVMFGEYCLAKVPGRKNTYVDPADESLWIYDQAGCVTPRSRWVRGAGAVVQLGLAFAAGNSSKPAVQYAAGPALQLTALGAEVVEEKMVNGCKLTLLRTSVRNRQVRAQREVAAAAAAEQPAEQVEERELTLDDLLGPVVEEEQTFTTMSCVADIKRRYTQFAAMADEAVIETVNGQCLAAGKGSFGPLSGSQQCGCQG